MAPLISIVTPVYKTEPWLRRCVDSILAQTLSDLELILVDDGSPDGSGAICDGYAAKDGRVRVIHKENGGVMSAVKAGILAAAGQYVGFVDSDDWVDPAYYEDLYCVIRDTGADVAVAEHVTHTPAGDEVFARPAPAVYPGPDGGRTLLYAFFRDFYSDTPPAQDVIWKCDKLYRRELLTGDLPYFDEAVWHGEDAMMNVAVLADCAKVALVSGGGMYHYLIRADSASHDGAVKLFTDRWAGNELAFLRALGRIIAEKGLERGPFLQYTGRVAYAAAVNFAARRDVSFRKKRRYVRQVAEAAMPGSLEEYARRRGSLPVTVYCRMLRARIAAPCVWMGMLSAGQGQR